MASDNSRLGCMTVATLVEFLNMGTTSEELSRNSKSTFVEGLPDKFANCL